MPGKERDIVVDVTVRSDTKGAKDAARALGDVDTAAGKAGGSMRGMQVDAKSLSAEIAKSTTKMRELEAQLVKVGNDKGVRSQLRAERSWLVELQKIQKTMADSNGFGGGGSVGDFSLGSLFPKGGGGSMPTLDLSALKGMKMPGLIGIGAALSPAIGAAISGAVVGAVGAGGIIGGIAIASTDQRVQNAWQEFAASFSGEMFGSETLAQPTMDAITLLRDGIRDMDLGSALRKGAAAIPTFASGITNLGKNLMPGFNAVMDDSGAIAGVFAEGMGDLGTATSDALISLTESEGTLEGLQMLFAATSEVISGTGAALGALGDGFHKMAEIQAWGSGILEDAPVFTAGMFASMNDYTEDLLGVGDAANKSFTMVSESAARAALGLEPFGTAVKFSGEAVKNLDEAITDLFNEQMGLDRAVLGWETSVDALTESVKENGRSLDATTEKGRANRDAILDAITAAEQQRLANIKSGMSAGDAAIRYQEQIDKLIVLGARLGLTKGQLEAIARNYAITITTTERRIIQETHREDYRMYGSGGNPSARADGGDVIPGMSYLINERGYETVSFNAGGKGQVQPAHLTPLGGGGLGAGKLKVELLLRSAGRPIEDLLLEILRDAVDARGGLDATFS